jgi:hypothetical protein
MSAFGGKADIGEFYEMPLLTKSGQGERLSRKAIHGRAPIDPDQSAISSSWL